MTTIYSYQQMDNLPEKILNLPRFVPTRPDNPKAPYSGWDRLENQHMLQDIPSRPVGFIAAIESGDLLFLDFDHVLNDNGEFVNGDAKRWYNFIVSHVENFYCERSVSGSGLHIFLRPTQGKFDFKIGKLTLDAKTKCAIEIFYKTNKNCFVTGDLFNCPPNAPIIEGDTADAIFQTLLAEIDKQNATTKKTAVDLGNDYDLFRAGLMLDTINPAELEDSDWLAVNSACKNIGVPYNVVDAFNRRDSKRYNEEENKLRWDSLNDPAFTIETLHGIANRFGYSDKDAQNQWRKLHPTSSKKIHKEKATEHKELEAELARLQADPKKNISRIQSIIRQLCSWNHDKNGNPTTIKGSSFRNHRLIFDNDPNLKNLFGRDDFRQETVFFRRATWHSPNAPLKDSWDDSDDAELRMYIRENYVEMSHPQTTFDFIIRVAREHSFHAIKRFLDSLPKWDGEERAPKIFVKFLGADDTEYTYEITMHILFGAIARALYPGCDFQEVPVLQGAQGIGKSRLVRMLGGKHGVNPKGENWHIALRDQLDDSHALDAMRKGWIVEIEEFAAGSRADVNAMKGVLSADDITRRFAYEKRAKTIKSHWIFIATCNDETPLRDQTGARRFLPIKCHNKESTIVEGMTAEYIRQVWAEAYYKFKQMFPTIDSFDADKLRLTPELQAQAAKYAEGITQDDGLATEIKGFLDRKIPPLAIWYLLTKEERRKFFVDGSITLLDAVSDLNHRARAKFGQSKAQDCVNQLDKIFNSPDTVIRKLSIKRGDDTLTEYHIYGTVKREHICAAEVFNECFGNDNRKRMPRINETLAGLEGWHAGERLQKIDPAYPDQKKPYFRDK